MKFAEFLINNIIPEWALMYFNYKALKAYLSTSGALKDFLLYAKKTMSTQEYREIKKVVMEKTYIMSKILADQKEFNKKLNQELVKIRSFMNAKYNDLKGKTYKIQLQILSMNRQKRSLERSRKRSVIRVSSQVAEELTEQLTNKQIKVQESDFNQKCLKLKELCFQLFNEGVNLEKYLKINQEAIRKLLKKQMKKSIKMNSEQVNLDECKKLASEINFEQQLNKVKQMLFQVQKYLLKNFYQTQQQVCKEQLRKYQFQNYKNNKAWFQFGLFTGFSLMLISFIIFLATQKQLNIQNNAIIYEQFPIYRGALLFILYYWSLTIVIYLWSKSKINYKLYFCFNHHFSTINEQLKRVMSLTSIFLLVSLFYLCDVSKLGIIFSNLKGEEYFPLIIWTSVFATVAFPSKFMINGQGRLWLYRNLWQCLNLKLIEQRHYFIFSQFTSLIIPFTDLTYTVCEYSKGINNQEETDFNQYDECFFISRYFTLALVLIPYLILMIQIIFLTQKQMNGNLFIIEFIRNIFSIVLIIFATLSYQESDLFYYWLGMAIFIAFFNIISSIKKWSYLDVKERRKKKQLLSYKQKLLIIYLPFGVIQPLSISTSIFGCFDKKEQHSLLILYIGIVELIRRMIVNYYIVDAEHFRHKQKYQSVGELLSQDTTLTTIVRESEILFRQDEIEDSDEDEKDLRRKDKEQITEIEVIITQMEPEMKRRQDTGLISQGQSISNQVENHNQKEAKYLGISELVVKESEKPLGESFFNYDIDDFKPEELNQIINCQQISESDLQSLHINNKNSKEEINRLYEEFGIKIK
ncbi:unnamed protein product (macronuclear) [Paramecium tetraurelia]|uniref:SPX domain-containing protein n=1 Tax=Paramecium tetraurelia TaxID=5888 RepID=A0CNT1_PARTE|nr:uncharacterized protein GSPATT00008890001 [Paramecium tetraurelia]CAK72448.1 unnamed protein product [Paramecium tetraurelia]|eukprot:XP_001439845.1 hypothetical protein (macronuclear) [Paramecium tetraurelia strain d4-2]